MLLRSVSIRGTVYDLGHLHDFSTTFIIPAKDGKPEQTYPTKVILSCHCFTRGMPTGGCPDEERYVDAREVRQFDAERHALSLKLPELIRGLAGRKCHHTDHGNFVMVDLVDDGGGRTKYAVFFSDGQGAAATAVANAGAKRLPSATRVT